MAKGMREKSEEKKLKNRNAAAARTGDNSIPLLPHQRSNGNNKKGGNEDRVNRSTSF